MSSISEALAAIESKCFWLKYDADELCSWVARLPFRRDFETMAEAAMDETEQCLIEALRVVRKSRAAYRNKQVEGRNAAA